MTRTFTKCRIYFVKKVEQVTKSGGLVLDYDETLSPKEIDQLMIDLFKPVLKKDDKQFILYNKIGILACNVTYLGHPHPLYKKRIQLKSYYLDYLAKNSAHNIKTLYLGIYTYKKTRLFVVFEPSTYAGKKSHNSSAHVYSINLQYAQRAGTFDKTDAFGNNIHIYNTYEFVRYIKTLGGELVGGITGDDIIKLIKERFGDFKTQIPLKWNGISCYKEMLEGNDANARQGEWQGWYFEFLFKKYLIEKHINNISWHADRTDSGIDLDIKFNDFKWSYGDLKADQINHDITRQDLPVVIGIDRSSIVGEDGDEEAHEYIVAHLCESLADIFPEIFVVFVFADCNTIYDTRNHKSKSYCPNDTFCEWCS
mgnify:CR=1 FL=1